MNAHGRIAVLGCGPAGLLAAHAAALAGEEFDIISIRRKAVLPGAMYLHRAIPDLTSAKPDATIEFLKVGTREEYARKVYGRPDAPCSWEEFDEGYVPAWSLYSAYEELWELYSPKIIDEKITQGMLNLMPLDYDLVISSIPAKALCQGVAVHKFPAAKVWVAGGDDLLYMPPDNTIIYSGSAQHGWYRKASIFGHQFTEFGHPVVGASPGVKPIATNCDCHPGIERVGRYGTWTKGVLTHQAFERATELVHAL